MISARSTWGDDPRRAAALADQVSLGTLVADGEQLQRDAAALLDRAAFLRDYVETLAELTARHGTPDGEPYRLVLGAYPDPEAGR